MIICFVVTACLLAPASAGASAARPLASLSASPAHLSLIGKASRQVRVMNPGESAVVVDVTRAGFALDLRGRPRVVPRGQALRAAVSWLRVRPGRFVLRPGAAASLTVISTPPRRPEPGEHDALVLLTTRPRPGRALAVRMRIGIVVVVRIPGRIVRRLVPLGLRVRHEGRVRLLELRVANRGNITETLSRRCVSVSLRRGGRAVARLRPLARRFLPRSSGIAEIRYAGRLRGWAHVRVAPTGRRACARVLHRTFRIRL
jgi:hypothetical protein